MSPPEKAPLGQSLSMDIMCRYAGCGECFVLPSHLAVSKSLSLHTFALDVWLLHDWFSSQAMALSESETLEWPARDEHEAICSYKLVPCDMCHDSVPKNLLPAHQVSFDFLTDEIVLMSHDIIYT